MRTEQPQTFYLVDVSGFIFRAFHALPPLTRPDGTPVGAVLGFTNMIVKLLTTHKPDVFAAVFDTGSDTFRKEIYPAYKAHRERPPDELIQQFPLVRQACQALGLPTVEKKWFEADDVIATLVTRGEEKGFETTIVSSDKDLMQLVSPSVRLWEPMKNRAIHEDDVVARFGVPPHQVIDVQAIMGDPSDNVPGIPRLGVKTAAALIQHFGSLEGIYERLEDIPQKNRKLLLEQHRDDAFLSKKLVTLCRDVPLEIDWDALVFKGIDMTAAVPFLRENRFTSLLTRFGQNPVDEGEAVLPLDEGTNKAPVYRLVERLEDLTTVLEEARRLGRLAFFLHCSSDQLLLGIALSVREDEAFYLPLGDTELRIEEVIKKLAPTIENKSILKIGWDLKDFFSLLGVGEDIIHTFDDVMLMSYVLDGLQHGTKLEDLVAHHFGQVIETKASEDHQTQDLASWAQHASWTLRLGQVFKKRLVQEHQMTLYTTIDKPMVRVLLNMEQVGVFVDKDVLNELSLTFSRRIERLTQEIHERAGEVFNIGSPKQLGEVLFDSLKFEGGKRGKSGAYSTDVSVLEKLALEGHDIAEKIIEWRHFSKLKSTYTDALVDKISPKTGRVHTSYVMAGTSTGRLASMHPNLQNIPIRTEEGRQIRRAFRAKTGRVLVALDYSQIELRLLAHMGQVQPLIDAFHQGIDIHRLTASQVFQIPLGEVTSDQRRQAKAINFGIIYGLSAFGLSQQLQLPQTETASLIDAYLKHYEGIQTYMEAQKEHARDHCFVTTLFGRRCYVPQIRSRNPHLRQAAERQAINAPLQGSNADIIKKAMIRIDEDLREHTTEARMILQVHDELVFESAPSKARDHAQRFKKMMSSMVSLCVPLEISIGLGPSWDELTPLVTK